MTSQSTLVLITADPNHSIATHAYRYVSALLKVRSEQCNAVPLHSVISVFFYAEAAHIANQLRWQTADKENLTLKWQQLSIDYGLTLPVCVSTALARGITNDDNAKRHNLLAANLATGFELVGLGELAQVLSSSNKVLQF